MYKEVLLENGVTQSPYMTLMILTYRMGKLFQIKVYQTRFSELIQTGNFFTELSSVVSQLYLLWEQISPSSFVTLSKRSYRLERSINSTSPSLSLLASAIGSLHSIDFLRSDEEKVVRAVAAILRVVREEDLSFSKLRIRGFSAFLKEIEEFPKEEV